MQYVKEIEHGNSMLIDRKNAKYLKIKEDLNINKIDV